MLHRRRHFIGIGICVFMVFSASICAAQSGGKDADLSVVYVDGTAELMVSSKWKTLEVGDKVAPDGTVRVGKNSTMQLSRAGLTLSFLVPGSFSVADILAKNTKAATTGIASALGKTARALTGTGQQAQKTGTVGGVRAAAVAKAPDTLWVDELEEVRTKVKALLAEEKFAEAAKILEAAQEEGLTDAENEEVSYLLASADYSLGGTARAWKAIADVNPDPSSKFYANIGLMKAQVLMEGNSFPEALDVLKGLTGPSVTQAKAQQAWFMIGLCRRALSDETAAQDAWTKGIAIAPSSDIGVLTKETMSTK